MGDWLLFQRLDVQRSTTLVPHGVVLIMYRDLRGELLRP